MDGEKILEAIKLLMKHYRLLWENYGKGVYVRRYIQLLKSLSRIYH